MENLTPTTVNDAFLAAPPAISSQILDMTVKHPLWMRDLYQVEEFGLGQGSVFEQIVFRSSKPTVERDFSKWKKIGNLSGCDPCDVPDCSYNWTTFGGHGFERKLTELMKRDFRSPDYCIDAIQTTAHFEQVFAKIVESLYAQIDFFKEINIGQTVLTMLAKKYVVDSSGPRPNPHNPYVYRNLGSARLATLNIDLLEFFYEIMCRIPEAIPYDVIDGAPVFALLSSRQLLSRLWRDDPGLRQDARFSGAANDLLLRYNFMSTIRGMFIPAAILYPRRFTISATGEPIEVLPFLNDVPMEVGAATYMNDDYEDTSIATHEEVIIHGKYPFKVLTMPTASTLGENTSFGPEQTFMNTWQWVNPLTKEDPARREGFFFTSAKIGIAQQYSEGIFAFLVERPNKRLTAVFQPNPPAEPEALTDPTNLVPDVTCPCPLVVSIVRNPFNPLNYTFVFGTPQDVVEAGTISLQLDNGLTLDGEVAQVTDDGLVVELTFAVALANVCASNIVGVACDDWAKCSATVIDASDCRSGQTGLVNLVLSNGIKAAAGDDILAFFGDCTTALLTIDSVIPETATYLVGYATGAGPTDDPTGAVAEGINAGMICDRGGIGKVCVPPETDDTCPACSPTLTACSDATS